MLNVQQRPLAALKRNPRNARAHSNKQISQIQTSIRELGFIVPIVIDDEGIVLAGHGRLLAAERIGLEAVPTVIVSHLNEAQKRVFALADNKIAANAGWDRAALAVELGELTELLPQLNLDISVSGFEPAEIDSLLTDFAGLTTEPDDGVAIASDQTPISRRGDLWQMGTHRLLCGDSTAASDMATLTCGQQAAMVFADPPYNVVIKKTLGRGRIKHREFLQGSGEMSEADFDGFLQKAMRRASEHSKSGSIQFFCIDWRHIAAMITAGKVIFGELANLIVWVKTNAGQGSFYRSQHELICVFKNGDAPHQNNVEQGKHGRNRTNVWQYPGVNTFRKDRMRDLAAHPTVKPITLIADAIKDCTYRNDIVLDPFLGSGTTLLAAERTGRRTYGLEIDPIYVDCAIKRWQDLTRRDAILESTGQTFDELAASNHRSQDRRAAP
ncbi:DNA methyltransferase [Bradyrhizobium sp. BR 10289]|uniref:site-specific DNA-methyltransferase n=1 Tax=Bradyrhizobium sp. BR 10289 TaxID=2749993 RepID=UPI001C646343|nr:DNA methyltransferase [Bradyrhizobium sp. BR 10289]MBW7974494.1 site-specific DNA-methyltransferase [Bradyrhizobium sp. BR 10289]